MTTLAWIIVLICVAITCYGCRHDNGEAKEAKSPKCIQAGESPYNPYFPPNGKAVIDTDGDLTMEPCGLMVNILNSRCREWEKKCKELEAEIKELKADIQERYEQAKEAHVWIKDQASDFNNLRDVAVKLEQENERLRAKLGMDSLAPSANKPAPEPYTKPNI